jgi:hypothetical protein
MMPAMKWFAALFALTPVAAPALADDSPAAAASRFLTVYATFHPSDGIPDAGGRARYSLVLSYRLNKQLSDAAQAEDRFRMKNRGSPPLLEGDLFTANFEGATSWRVGPCVGDPKAAHCDVLLRHEENKQKLTEWTDTFYLVMDPAGWRLDDVAYGGGFAFGNTGRLSATLKSTMTQAR